MDAEILVRLLAADFCLDLLGGLHVREGGKASAPPPGCLREADRGRQKNRIHAVLARHAINGAGERPVQGKGQAVSPRA